VITDECIKTDEYVDLGTGNMSIGTGGSVIFVNSNITMSRYNISTTDTNKIVINISWSSNDYFLNITG